jgi:hypothetical protein
MAAYDRLRAELDTWRAARSARRGDPRATSPGILTLVDLPDPPPQIFLGDGPLELIRTECANRIKTRTNTITSPSGRKETSERAAQRSNPGYVPDMAAESSPHSPTISADIASQTVRSANYSV